MSGITKVIGVSWLDFPLVRLVMIELRVETGILLMVGHSVGMMTFWASVEDSADHVKTFMIKIFAMGKIVCGMKALEDVLSMWQHVLMMMMIL